MIWLTSLPAAAPIQSSTLPQRRNAKALNCHTELIIRIELWRLEFVSELLSVFYKAKEIQLTRRTLSLVILFPIITGRSTSFYGKQL